MPSDPLGPQQQHGQDSLNFEGCCGGQDIEVGCQLTPIEVMRRRDEVEFTFPTQESAGSLVFLPQPALSPHGGYIS